MRQGLTGGGVYGGLCGIRWVSLKKSFWFFSPTFSSSLDLDLDLKKKTTTNFFQNLHSYDTVRYVYGSKLPFSSAPPDNEKLPDMHLARYDDVVAFDGASKLAYCVSWAHLDEHDSLERSYADARSRLSALSARLAAAGRTGGPRLPASKIASELETSRRPERPDASSNMTRDEFLGAVAATKEHILAGDVFQLVLSQRFERRTYADPFEVYRALRVVNPSPYMIYLQCRGAILVASSPEILCRVGADRRVTNRPLAGTRARGADAAADRALEEELLADAKERAEHVMLVDLGRNDVGRVASPGTVEVEKLMVRGFDVFSFFFFLFLFSLSFFFSVFEEEEEKLNFSSFFTPQQTTKSTPPPKKRKSSATPTSCTSPPPSRENSSPSSPPGTPFEQLCRPAPSPERPKSARCRSSTGSRPRSEVLMAAGSGT